MLDKFLLAIFITSLGSIGVLAPKAVGQEPPECYIVDESGELEDLTDICNASQKRSPNPTTTQGENIKIGNSESKSVNTGVSVNDGFVVGVNASSKDSGAINGSYLIDNEPGSDYTAYVRRYKTSPNSLDRLTSREEIFQFDNRNRSQTSILRRDRELPFIIYRY